MCVVKGNLIHINTCYKPVIVKLHMYGHISIRVISEMCAIISEMERSPFPEK